MLRRILRDPALAASLSIIILILALTIAAPLLATHDPTVPNSNGLSAIGGPLGPSKVFLLGTDQYGRDEWSRLIYGGRSAIFVSLIASLVASAVGYLLGAVAALYGGWVDTIVTRLTNILMSFPLTLFAVAMVMIVSPSLGNLIFVMSAIYWTYTARLVRAEVMTLKESDFIHAAETVGVRPWRILIRHLLPNVTDTLVIRFSLSIAQTFLLESGLSFLGVGVQPPTPDWGLMIAQSQNFYAQDPGLVLYPGLAIVLTVIAFNVLGDGLQRVFVRR